MPKERAARIDERHAYGLKDGIVVCLKCGKRADLLGRVGLLWDVEKCPTSSPADSHAANSPTTDPVGSERKSGGL